MFVVFVVFVVAFVVLEIFLWDNEKKKSDFRRHRTCFSDSVGCNIYSMMNPFRLQRFFCLIFVFFFSLFVDQDATRSQPSLSNKVISPLSFFSFFAGYLGDGGGEGGSLEQLSGMRGRKGEARLRHARLRAQPPSNLGQSCPGNPLNTHKNKQKNQFSHHALFPLLPPSPST
jgi:hypothetical protein